MGEGEKESWNMANATLKRFDFILKQCSVFSQTGQLLNWKNALMDLRRNLCPFMTDTELGEVETKFNELPINWIISNGRTNPQHYAQVNKTFDIIYMKFIIIMKKKGLLMPKTIDSGKSVIEM